MKRGNKNAEKNNFFNDGYVYSFEYVYNRG